MELPTMEELTEAIKKRCFPMTDNTSSAKTRVMRRIVDIEDLPIELKAESFYQYIDGKIRPVTVKNLRSWYLVEEDYQAYLKELFNDSNRADITIEYQLFYNSSAFNRYISRETVM